MNCLHDCCDVESRFQMANPLRMMKTPTASWASAKWDQMRPQAPVVNRSAHPTQQTAWATTTHNARQPRNPSNPVRRRAGASNSFSRLGTFITWWNCKPRRDSLLACWSFAPTAAELSGSGCIPFRKGGLPACHNPLFRREWSHRRVAHLRTSRIVHPVL